MKYDFFYRKLEAFWSRYKWWIIGVFVLVIAAGIALEFWPKTPDQRIRSAISKYHKEKGQTIDFQSLSFRSVSAGYPDSIQLKLEAEHFHNCSQQYLKWFSLSEEGDPILLKYRDSMYMIEMNAHRLDSIYNTTKNNPAKFVKCDYVARITAPSESFTDTFSVVLNDSLRVVFAR